MNLSPNIDPRFLPALRNAARTLAGEALRHRVSGQPHLATQLEAEATELWELIASLTEKARKEGAK